jgi:hypothetical protein
VAESCDIAMLRVLFLVSGVSEMAGTCRWCWDLRRYRVSRSMAALYVDSQHRKIDASKG